MKRGRNPRCPTCKQPLFRQRVSRRARQNLIGKVILVCFGISLFICLALCIFDAFPVF